MDIGTVQAKDQDVWRDFPVDDTLSKDGASIPRPQPLSRRLSELKSSGAHPKTEEPDAGVGFLTSDAPSNAGETCNKDHTNEGDLRLDGGMTSPMRGPPKTPKRNKASSPQVNPMALRFFMSGTMLI